MTAPNSYFGYMGTLYFCVTCMHTSGTFLLYLGSLQEVQLWACFQISIVRVREPCLWTAAQFPNSERVSLKQRMIFRAGQLAGRGLVMAFVNWGAASSCLEPGLSSKTGSKPRDTEHRGPSVAAQMMMVSMTNILMTTEKGPGFDAIWNHIQDGCLFKFSSSFDFCHLLRLHLHSGQAGDSAKKVGEVIFTPSLLLPFPYLPPPPPPLPLPFSHNPLSPPKLTQLESQAKNLFSSK